MLLRLGIVVVGDNYFNPDDWNWYIGFGCIGGDHLFIY